MKGLPRSLSRGSATSRQAVSKLKIPLNTTITITATGAAIGWGTMVIGDFPEAHLKVLSVACILDFAGSGADANLAATWEGDVGIGTTPASDATISVGDEDLITETAIAAATAEVAPTVMVADGVDLVLDNTDGSLEVNLNVLVDAADITDDESVILTVSGVVEIVYITMLDD